jgi:hypothetical protein
MSEAMLRDPQLYAQQVSEMAHRLFTALHVPSPAQVWQAGGSASHDGYQAIVSISQFIVLIGRPFVLALGWFVVTSARLIWEHVIVNGLYNHGLSQTKGALFTLWKFQKGLTPKQLLLEAVVCAALVAIYLLRQWLQRNRYIQRAQVWINRKSRQTQEVSSDVCVVLLDPWSSVVLAFDPSRTAKSPWRRGADWGWGDFFLRERAVF